MRRPDRKTSRRSPSRRGSSAPRTNIPQSSKAHTTRKKETVAREGTKRKGLEQYKITYYYHYKGAKKRQETVSVLARDADDALNHGNKLRRVDRKPTSITIKDGLGDVFLKLARSAGKVIGTAKAVKQEYEAGKIQGLVDRARSDNEVTRVIARRELKKRYPNVHESIAFEEV